MDLEAALDLINWVWEKVRLVFWFGKGVFLVGSDLKFGIRVCRFVRDGAKFSAQVSSAA